MKAGIVEVFKLGKDYQLVKNKANDYYEFIYRDSLENIKRDAYRYVVNASGQAKSLKTNPSALVRNLIRRGTVQIKESRLAHRNHTSAADSVCALETYKTGSIWIGPETHQIMQIGPDNKIAGTSNIYAVGAMTRGQIVDASMARGIVQATSRIADDLIGYLTMISR